MFVFFLRATIVKNQVVRNMTIGKQKKTIEIGKANTHRRLDRRDLDTSTTTDQETRTSICMRDEESDLGLDLAARLVITESQDTIQETAIATETETEIVQTRDIPRLRNPRKGIRIKNDHIINLLLFFMIL